MSNNTTQVNIIGFKWNYLAQLGSVETEERLIFQINTKRFETKSSGMNHVEGGWPKDINPNDFEQTSRSRKKLEKEESFRNSIVQLGTVRLKK